MGERTSSREMVNSGLQSSAEDGLHGTSFIGVDYTPHGFLAEKGFGEHDDDLKQLLLVNLDLIQSQQELLTTNERTILALRRENEMLKCRLDRIERRMSLFYHKEFSSTVTSSASASRQHSETYPTKSVSSRTLMLESPDEFSEISNSIIATSVTDTNKKLKLEENDELMKNKIPVAHVSLRKSTTKPSASESKTKRRCDMLHITSQLELIQKQANVEENEENCEKIDCRYRVKTDSEILLTDALYYVPLLSANDDNGSEEDDRLTRQELIIVPSWRTKLLSSLYVMEGTENLDDRVFLKRHQKSEAEEKRRKRWDIQRLKDLQLLRRQQPKVIVNFRRTQDIASFLPNTDKAMFVEVNEKIPVSAFGSPVPSIEKQEFKVPWYSINKDHTAKNKRLRKI